MGVKKMPILNMKKKNHNQVIFGKISNLIVLDISLSEIQFDTKKYRK